MRTFASMRAAEPDLFIHSGDLIYADTPIPETLRLDDGSTWRNLVEDGVGEVAQTLDQFRGRYRYNLRDAHLRAFNAEVPMVAQWDDHEVLNNWYPTEVLGIGRQRRALHREAGVGARGAREAGVLRLRADPAGWRERAARSAAGLSRRPPRAAGRGVRARLPQLPRAEHRQPAARGRSGDGDAGGDAAGLARGGAGALAPRRGRSSPAISRSAWSCRDGPLQEGFANADPRTLGPRARGRGAALGAQAPPRPQRPVRHRRRALRRRAPLRPGARDLAPTSIRSGSSWPDRSTPARSARACSTRRSAPRRSSRRWRRSPIARPATGCSSSGWWPSIRRRAPRPSSLHDREGRVLYTKVVEPAT